MPTRTLRADIDAAIAKATANAARAAGNKLARSARLARTAEVLWTYDPDTLTGQIGAGFNPREVTAIVHDLAAVIGGTPQVNAHELQTELEATGSVDGLTVTVWGVLSEASDTPTMTPVKMNDCEANGHG